MVSAWEGYIFTIFVKLGVELENGTDTIDLNSPASYNYKNNHSLGEHMQP
jgi:hypothetical protein